ncbi:amidohydrolase family protein [Planctomycetota bacterium]
MKNTHTAISMITCLLLITSVVGCGQRTKQQSQLPIIDMHAHALGENGDMYATEDLYGNVGSANHEMLFKETYEQFRKFNVIKAVVSGPLQAAETWKSKDEDNRIISGIMMMVPNDYKMDPARFESLIKAGKIEVFGEIIPPLSGTTLSDPEWRPYLKICEQYDVPVAAHTGLVGPAVAGTWTSKTRLRLGDPYLIEDVLVRYPKLRIYICHSGSEWHEHALVLMQCYRQLYSDIGASLWVSPLAQRYIRQFLANAKQAGCLNRVMFGSDQVVWPHAIEMSIEYLNSLDFLTEKDKRDILYNNAARFLRLKEEK